MKSIPIVQLGFGAVGRELARQLLAQREALAARYGVSLDYLAIADSAGALYTGQPLSAEAVLAAAEAKAAGWPLSDAGGVARTGSLATLRLPARAIAVDVSASGANEVLLADAVRFGHRVVLANKKPLAGALTSFRALTEGGATRYEATVGAGLPVIGTLQALLDSGDQVVRIEAAMSGTLGYLCGELEAGNPLSAAVRAAHALGYTEPDPRDDLSGADVARKALILARTCGLPWDLAGIPAEPWFPPELAAVSRDEFMARLEELDAPLAARVAEARDSGGALRYVAEITPDGASVGLRVLPAGHPLAGLRGPDNLFSFTTTRYAERPLVVRGPGAGVPVTAAGVLADIVATAREMRP
ncbi:MAG: homoserine dehydrogenase [Chloroflexi bacterium OHK40]